MTTTKAIPDRILLQGAKCSSSIALLSAKKFAMDWRPGVDAPGFLLPSSGAP